VIFVDLLMPGLSGQELVCELQHHPDLGRVPVVLMSGFEAAEEDLPPSGSYQAILVKPFELQELDAVLEAATSWDVSSRD
jgi:CheY-like chemotaxis protein